MLNLTLFATSSQSSATGQLLVFSNVQLRTLGRCKHFLSIDRNVSQCSALAPERIAAKEPVDEIAIRYQTTSAEEKEAFDGRCIVVNEAPRPCIMQQPNEPLSEELEAAIRESAASAAAQERAYVQEALLRSKIEAVQRQQLVVLRLTKRNSDVLDVLVRARCLQQVRAQVEDAGCEILPE